MASLRASSVAPPPSLVEGLIGHNGAGCERSKQPSLSKAARWIFVPGIRLLKIGVAIWLRLLTRCDFGLQEAGIRISPGQHSMTISTVTPPDIHSALLLRQEIALLDIRHEAEFATGHPLFAANMAAGRIALEAEMRLPRKNAPIVLYDAGEGLVPQAAEQLGTLGYTNIRQLTFEGKRSGEGYFSATIEAERLNAPRLEYFIEGVASDGRPMFVLGSAMEPQAVNVEDVPKPKPALRVPATVTLSTDYADWNNFKGNDVVWQTEGSVDLARLAGCRPAGVICEIMREDGEMARLPELEQFAAKHGLLLLSVADLIAYRLLRERIVRRQSTGAMRPGALGPGDPFVAHYYDTEVEDTEYLALVRGDVAAVSASGQPVLVRVAAMDPLADPFMLRPDLLAACEAIEQAGTGVLLYVVNRSRTRLGPSFERHVLQRARDKVTALQADSSEALRDFGLGAQVLADLGLKRIRLMMWSDRKIAALEGFGIEVVERVPVPGRRGAVRREAQ